ncbi:MAG: DUF4347 domain-containing protein, partial [Burkholderiaceae bacterium]
MKWFDRLAHRLTRRAAPDRAVVEACDLRILYSAELHPLAPAAEVRQLESVTASSAVVRHELVFIDARVSDPAALLEGLVGQRGGREGLEFHRLRDDEEGLAQITQALAGRQDVAAIHVLAHGRPGALWLGAGEVDGATLRAQAAQLQSWRAALSDDADLLVYGCELGAGMAGADFVATLAELSGADVSASLDATGAADRGGNWVLEAQRGPIETATLQAPSWQGLLALPPTFAAGDGRIDLGVNINYAGSVVKTVVQADGSVLVLTNSGTPAAGATSTLTRYRTDGALDSTFGTGGSLLIGDSQGRASQLVIDGNGNIVVGINGLNGSAKATLRTYSAVNGSVVGSNVSVQQTALTALIANGGNLYAVSTDGAGTNGFVERFVVSGGSTYWSSLLPSTSKLRSASFNPVTERVVVAATDAGIGAIYVVNSDSTRDAVFEGNSSRVLGALPRDVVWGNLQEANILIRSDGKSVAMFSFDVGGGNSKTYAVPLHETAGGSLGGWTLMGDLRVNSAALNGDEKMVLAGSRADGVAQVIRRNLILGIYDPVMSLDTSFDGDGILELPAVDKNIRSIGLYPKLTDGVADNRIAVVGMGTDGNAYLRRITYGGQVDPNFDSVKTSTLTSSPTPVFTENGNAVVIAPNAAIFDPDRGATGANYGGAYLTVTSGSSDARFALAASQSLTLSNGKIVDAGVEIATFAQSQKVLSVNFLATADQSRVNRVLRSLTYANASEIPVAVDSLSWVFNEPALSVTEVTSVNIIPVNDAPTFANMSSGSSYS